MYIGNIPLAILGLGTQEILLIVLAALVLFGARKIPEFARGLGQGIREFKNATNNVKSEIQREINDDSNSKPADDKTMADHSEKRKVQSPS